MVDYTDLKDASDICLDKDGLLEASAGTGKTYTLTRLAVRLLLHHEIDIEKLLIVTYTEKAAGEMKERLRELLEDAARTGIFLEKTLSPAAVAHLRRQALHYDHAPVQTIHSFCLATLRRYAFENGYHFTTEQGKDEEIAREALHSVLEKEYPEKFGTALEQLLDASGFKPASGFESGWEKQIIKLALTAQERHSVLLPSVGDDLAERFSRECRALLQALRTAASVSGKFFAEDRRPIETAMQLLDADAEPFTMYAALTHFLHPKGLMKAHADDQEAAAAHAALASLVQKIKSIGDEFVAELVIRTRSETRHLKERRQQISFNDMLTRVEEGLARPGGLLRDALRNQFKAALVDEFQDTDPVQWAIFRTVFLESPEHRLYIIGDPKQAIYGFRGADINTYYAAAAELERCTPDTARCYRLPKNWRSVQAAITAGNAFFTQYFRSSGKEETTPCRMIFRPVSPAPQPRNRLCMEDASAAGLYGVDLGKGLADPLRLNAARRIAADCHRLLNSGLRLSLDGGEERAVDPGDLCVLSRTKKTSLLVERELMRLGLPCTIYKKEGIYGTSEALHLSLILRHLAAPEDGDLLRLALLTRFFVRTAGLAPAAPEPEEAAGHFLARLGRLARTRNWGELFRVLLQESGILLREYPLPDGPRRVTNLEQICQSLETTALANGFDIHRLAEHLVRLLNDEGEIGDDETLHRIESEEPRIRLMTTHTSKGLEFPFVWVTMPLEGNGGNRDRWHTFSANGTRVYDLNMSHKEQHDHECEEEAKRLLYVALTRGIFRTVLYYKESDARFLTLPAPPAPDTTDDTPWRPDRSGAMVPLPEPLFILPEQFLKDGFRRRRVSLASFSSLAGHIDDGPAFGETPRAEPDEPEAPLPELEGTLLLPRGPRTGNLLHSLLETVDFSAAAAGLEDFSKTIRPQVTAALFRSRIKPAPGWSGGDKADAHGALIQEVCRLLYGALTVPLTDRDGGTFRLWEIPPADRKHELEFHFRMDPQQAALLDSDSFHFSHGFITGFIDLVFRRDGRYHILDWKSNWLPAWDSAALQKGMQAHQYNLQASIYAEALTRWLRVHTLPAGREALGGVYYLFLRGIPEGGGVHSIYDPEPFPAPREATHA